MENRVSARRLAWASLVGQGLFTVGWIVGGAADPGYSPVRGSLAALAAHDAAHPWVAVAGMIALALSIAALGLALRSLGGIVVASFLVAGAATFSWAMLRLDCDPGTRVCRKAFDAGLLSWTHGAHFWAGLLMSVALVVTAFTVAAALWPRPAGVVALGCGVFALAISVVEWFAWGHGVNGLVDRLTLVPMHIWLIALAVGVLYSTRPEPVPPTPTPLRPRDFFGRDWTGRGELTLRPLWLWRTRPQPFTFSRTASWLSDEAWTFEDRASFANGWSESRIRFCHFESPTRVSVVSQDMPDGATVLFDDAGYRILPFRMTVPFGPLPLPVRCRDSAAIDDDGTLVETVEVSFAGIPVARAVMRAQTVPPTVDAEPHAPVALTG